MTDTTNPGTSNEFESVAPQGQTNADDATYAARHSSAASGKGSKNPARNSAAKVKASKPTRTAGANATDGDVEDHSSRPAVLDAAASTPVPAALSNGVFIMPADVKLPLPQAPVEAHEITSWMEVYRAHVELARFDLELTKMQAERAKALTDLRRSQLDEGVLEREQRKAAVEMETAELALSAALRTERNAATEAAEAMVYTFSETVDHESVRNAISTLDLWSRRAPGKPITIQLNSPGGSVIHGLALYDFILSLRARDHEVTIVALGMAASMGSILLQAGDHRVMGPNAYVMLHEVSSWHVGKTSNIEDDFEFHKRLEKRLIEILCERSTFTPETLRKRWKKTDMWLDAQDSLKVGLVDRIGVM